MAKIYILLIFLIAPRLVSGQDIDLMILKGEYDNALQLIESKLAENDSQPILYQKQGSILQMRFDFENALRSYEKAYLLDSTNSRVLNDLAEVHTALGNYRQALPLFKKLYCTDTTNAANAVKLSRAYFNQRSYQEPYRILISAYRRDSDNIYITKQLAFAAVRTARDSFAISLYTKIIRQNQTDLNNFTALASLYQKKENYPKVFETLEMGLSVFPGEAILLLKLADTHFAKRNYAKAIEFYEKYQTISDTNFDVLKNLGMSYYYEKRTQEGLSLLEQCLTMKPNDPVTGLFVGLCYKDLKAYDESIAYLNFASRIALPYYLSDIYNQLGNIYIEKNKYKEAVKLLKKAYSLDSSKCEILFKIANTYDVWQKDKSQATRYYDNYLKSKKEEDDMHRKLTEYVLDRKKKLAKWGN